MESKNVQAMGDGTLIKRVLEAQHSEEGMKELIRDLSLQIYRYPLTKAGGSEDDAGEFYLYFFPRLKRLLVNFKDQGVPFQHYFHSLLYWNLKSYLRLKRKKRSRWLAARCRELWDIYQADPSEEPAEGRPADRRPADRRPEDPFGPCDGAEASSVRAYNVVRANMQGRIADATARRRLLFLALRYCREMDPASIEKLAGLTGRDVDWLRERITHLRWTMASREERLERLRERRNHAFCRARLLEMKIRSVGDGERRAQLAKALDRCQRTMRGACTEITRIPLSPTHRAIAIELGVPKGTVDTGIRWIKGRICLYSAPSLKYAGPHGAAAGLQQCSQTGRAATHPVAPRHTAPLGVRSGFLLHRGKI
jgi:hypothetical protein